jgi:hypothetical protein
MATNRGDRVIDEDDRIRDVLPRICGRESDPRKRTRIVEKHDVRMVARHCTRRNV